MGFLCGDGTIAKDKTPIIVQSIIHKKQIDRIINFYNDVFGRKPNIIYSKNGRIAQIYFSKLCYKIYSYFTKNNFENILQLNDDCLKAFFAGLIDSDGSVCIKNSEKGKVIHIQINLGLSQKEYQTLLVALKRFGCYGAIRTEKTHYIIITGREDVELLANALKGISIKVDEKIQKIPVKKEIKRIQRDVVSKEIVKTLFQKIYENINTSILVQNNLASTFDDYRKENDCQIKKLSKMFYKKFRLMMILKINLIFYAVMIIILIKS